ncbi:MAG: tetratricopeptide repeat protein, partial [Planctomycetota bacterium]
DVARKALDENIFEPTLREIEEQFAEQPLVQAQLLQSVATALRHQQLVDQAVAPQEQALEIRRRELGDAHIDTLRSLIHAGQLAHDRSRFAEADRYLAPAVQIARGALGDDDKVTLWALNSRGIALNSWGRFAEAEACFEEALTTGQLVFGEEHSMVATYTFNLGQAMGSAGKKEEAEDLFIEALRIRKLALGDEHPQTLNASRLVGDYLRDQGKLEEAEPYLRAPAERLGNAYGEEHWMTLIAKKNFAGLLREMGELEEAERLAAEVVHNGRNTWLDERPGGPPRYLLEHGRILIAMERFGHAEEQLLQVQGMLEDTAVPIQNVTWFKKESIRLAEAFVDLYEGWHAAEPDAGYGAKAAEWLVRLEATRAADPDELAMFHE